MRSHWIITSLTVVAVVLFLWSALGFDFLQDDAYISFRYVENYLSGHGLVFNIGERVEGYTNFGWVLFLLLGGVAGLDYLLLAKLAGMALGVVTILSGFLIVKLCLNGKKSWLAAFPIVLVAFNPSLAYWSQAGLETTAFASLAALSLYFFLKRHPLLIATLVAAVLVRPEGALLAGLFILIELIVAKRRPRFALGCALMALLLSLPFVGFKLAYYGSILPNPFYAKTGFDFEQLASGLDYTLRFFSHYPLFGAALLFLPWGWRTESKESKAVWLFGLLFCLYVLVIGGDVLKVHRFFIPVLVPLAVLVTIALHRLTEHLTPKLAHPLLAVALLGLVWAGIALPDDFIARYERREIALTHKMSFLAEQFKKSDRYDFSVATTTIGIFSYRLPGHRIIDMLGLTDSTIARHPEPAVPGLESTWRERGYNTSYLLEQAPDYIVFSTGVKPSAPAERALMLYRPFLDCYRTVSWEYAPPPGFGDPIGFPAFKRRCFPEPPFEPELPAEFVNEFNHGINSYSSGKYDKAERHLLRALEVGGEPAYVYVLYFLSLDYFQTRQYDRGDSLQNYIVAIDSSMYEPQADRYVYEYATGDRAKAAIHRRWLLNLVPWRVPAYDSLAHVRAAAWQARRNR